MRRVRLVDRLGEIDMVVEVTEEEFALLAQQPSYMTGLPELVESTWYMGKAATLARELVNRPNVRDYELVIVVQ